MFKFLGLTLMLSAVVFAGDHHKGHGEPKPLMVAEFRDEMAALQRTAIDVTTGIDGVLNHAVHASMDHSGASWAGFEEKFGSMLKQSTEAVAQESKRMISLIGRLWERPGDFMKMRACSSVAYLAEHREGVVNLEEALVTAMIADLGCFREEFAGAEHLRIGDMVSPFYSEAEAVQVIKDVFEKLYYIKQSGEEFGNALSRLRAEVDAGHSSSPMPGYYPGHSSSPMPGYYPGHSSSPMPGYYPGHSSSPMPGYYPGHSSSPMPGYYPGPSSPSPFGKRTMERLLRMLKSINKRK